MKLFRYLVYFTVYACCAVQTHAQSQDAAANPVKKTALEEVIVTAQKREQSLQDVPMAVTAIGGAQIAQNEINNIEDLAKLVPSFKVQPGGGATQTLRMRGVGTNVFSVAVEPNVSMVLDGVPLARNSLSEFDFADVARVEVLRGPQGTLFGKNASAGLVHVITRDPADHFEGFIRASYQEPDELPGDYAKTQFSTSGPLSDTVGMRVTGFWRQEHGFIEDINANKTMGDTEGSGGRIKLRWDASDTLAFKLNLEHQDSKANPGAIVWGSGNPDFQERSRPIEFGPENRQMRGFGNDKNHRRVDAVSLDATWTVGDYTLASITGWREGLVTILVTAADLSGDRIDLVQGAFIDIRTFTQEFRITSPNSDVLEWTAGMLWFDNDLDRVFDRAVTDIPAGFVTGTPNPPDLSMIPGAPPDTIQQIEHIDSFVDTNNLGLYAQATWHFADVWHATAGLRYIDEEVTAQFNTYSLIQDSATETTIEEASRRFNGPEKTIGDTTVTGMVSLQYDWADHSVVYTTLSRGYRGVAFDLVVSSGQEALDNPVDPETATSFEVGIKSRLLEDSLELNATVFHTIFEDFQAQILDLSGGVGNTEFRLANAGELQTSGLELDFKWIPAENWFVYGALLYNRAIFNEFITQCFPGQGPNEGYAQDVDNDGTCDAQDASGGSLPNAPRWSGSFTGRHEAWLNQSRMLFSQVSWQWQSEVNFTSEQHPVAVEGAYGTLNLRLGLNDAVQGWEVAAYVNNALAKNRRIFMLPLSLENDRRDVIHTRRQNADRVVGLSVSWRF